MLIHNTINITKLHKHLWDYYNVNPQYNQYNQVAQAPMGSDIREVQINQNPGPTYEKPM